MFFFSQCYSACICDVFAPQPRSRDTIGEDGFFDLLSRFQGNRMDDQRCSLLDGPSHLPAHPSPSSTLPVAEKKCEWAPCFHRCSHHMWYHCFLTYLSRVKYCTRNWIHWESVGRGVSMQYSQGNGLNVVWMQHVYNCPFDVRCR